VRMSRTFLDRNFGRLALAKNVPFLLGNEGTNY